MKKTFLALAVSAAVVATGANASDGKQDGSIEGTTVYSSNGNSLEIGGRAEARMSLKDGKAADNSRVRLNFLGKTQITDGLYGVGFYEGEFTTADNGGATDSSSDSLTNRYAYAGIGGTYGELTYGKNDGALGVITDFTDIMAYHGNSAADKINAADRADNMLTYKGQFSDFDLKASYRFADRIDNDPSGEFTENAADGYSLSAIYSIGDSGVKLGGGYAEQDKSNEYMLAASYRIGGFYIAGNFTDGEKDFDSDQYNNTSGLNDHFSGIQDYRGVEAAVAYNLNQWVFTSTYNTAETDGYTTADNIAVDATYYFKPNFRAYASYNFNLMDKDDVVASSAIGEIAAENEMALGLRYDF
ncbi:porin [Vibrio sp. 99-8-1]|uniref:porin n=1 Tax=Vibrio sp. 99-8-1 TaxID=2607602 RepID=UPI0014939D3F|nr:porin [Vibrio sp. 99-8-1]NOI64802.1 porin [Vibrio sp. 99-8-1]